MPAATIEILEHESVRRFKFTITREHAELAIAELHRLDGFLESANPLPIRPGRVDPTMRLVRCYLPEEHGNTFRTFLDRLTIDSAPSHS